MKYLIVSLLLFVGCLSNIPKPENFKQQECYMFLECMYLLQKNTDKSVCVGLSDECRTAMREARQKK